MKTHLTVGIYANKQWTYNIVRDEDLQQHIEYNKVFRFGRLLYVDDVRVYNGCTTEEYLAEYDERYKEIREQIGDITYKAPTIPYR